MSSEWRRAEFAAIGALLMAWNLAGCTAEDDAPLDAHVADTGVDAGDTTSDTGAMDTASDLVCAESEFEIARQLVRIMLVLDQSNSMSGRTGRGEKFPCTARGLRPSKVVNQGMWAVQPWRST